MVKFTADIPDADNLYSADIALLARIYRSLERLLIGNQSFIHPIRMSLCLGPHFLSESAALFLSSIKSVSTAIDGGKNVLRLSGRFCRCDGLFQKMIRHLRSVRIWRVLQSVPYMDFHYRYRDVACSRAHYRVEPSADSGNDYSAGVVCMGFLDCDQSVTVVRE